MYYFYVDNYMESVNVENLFDINLLNNSEKLKFCKGFSILSTEFSTLIMRIRKFTNCIIPI